MKFGLMIPAFASLATHATKPSTLVDFARKAEDLGYDSLWAVDHFSLSPAYGQTWLEPLSLLSYVAAVTSRIRIGTAVLVGAFRHPSLAAKEIASIHFLSGGRFEFGVGTGWNPSDFAALGVPRSERGTRTDEFIEACYVLWRGEAVSYAGRHYHMDEVTVEPRLATLPRLWVGGGSQPPVPGSSAVVRMPARVVRRIARADGFIATPQPDVSLMREDWAEIQRAAAGAGRDPAGISLAQMNYFHLVETSDRAHALALQQPYFDRYTGSGRRFDYSQKAYLVGTVDDVLARIDERRRAGAEYAILGPVTVEPETLDRQLDLLTRLVVKPLS